MIAQQSARFVLSALKWAQITLAFLVTGFFVLLLPGVGEIGVALGCLYIAWAIRARSDHRLSVWLAFLFTVVVALVFGAAVAGDVAGDVSRLEFLLELLLFLVAAAVLLLHGINWRWLISRPARTPW